MNLSLYIIQENYKNATKTDAKEQEKYEKSIDFLRLEVFHTFPHCVWKEERLKMSEKLWKTTKTIRFKGNILLYYYAVWKRGKSTSNACISIFLVLKKCWKQVKKDKCFYTR